MHYQLGSERFHGIRDSDVKMKWVPFSDGVVSEKVLGSWAFEMRDGCIESVASVMIIYIVECSHTLCYITVLIVVRRIEK